MSIKFQLPFGPTTMKPIFCSPRHAYVNRKKRHVLWYVQYIELVNGKLAKYASMNLFSLIGITSKNHHPYGYVHVGMPMRVENR